jgi:Ca2+-binding EF-hand superfamily protein
MFDKPLYLQSLPITPMVYARFSRNQEVSVASKMTYNTVWRIQPTKGVRQDRKGEPVNAADVIVLEHVATSQYLSNDEIVYQNAFGNETEVSALNKATKSKTQILANENNGHQVRENILKSVDNQNFFQFVFSTNPAAAEPVAEAPKMSSGELLSAIKAQLISRGSMQIRGIGRMFRILDDNRNHKLDKRELSDGLKDYGIHLTDAQTDCLFDSFDRDSNGQVNFDELLVALRGELNENRLSWIKAAYNKLDKNGDGLVKLDDIAQIYDASEHPEVKQGRPAEEAYMEFMSLWDTQVADGIVTFEEFCQYFRDVSASIDTDEYFAVMMKNAWKL